jgi:vitamin B12 transporter
MTMKRLTRAFFVSLLVTVALVVAAQAQTADSDATISGHVKDPQNANLPRATVSLHGRDRSFSLVTTTDSSGAYSFKHLAQGEYLIEAEASGFALAPAQTLTLTRGQTATLNITLQLSGLRSSVVITASDSPQTVDEVSKALTVVDTQEIEERNELAIPESLRTVPGLRVQQLGGPG